MKNPKKSPWKVSTRRGNLEKSGREKGFAPVKKTAKMVKNTFQGHFRFSRKKKNAISCCTISIFLISKLFAVALLPLKCTPYSNTQFKSYLRKNSYSSWTMNMNRQIHELYEYESEKSWITMNMNPKSHEFLWIWIRKSHEPMNMNLW